MRTCRPCTNSFTMYLVCCHNFLNFGHPLTVNVQNNILGPKRKKINTQTCSFLLFIEFSCADPGPVAGSTTSLLDKAIRYQCNTGYFLASGTSYRSCKDDGTWTGQAPVCKSM